MVGLADLPHRKGPQLGRWVSVGIRRRSWGGSGADCVVDAGGGGCDGGGGGRRRLGGVFLGSSLAERGFHHPIQLFDQAVDICAPASGV